MWTRILRITCVVYIQYHSWHAESYLEGHGLWARGHSRGQTNRQNSNERSFLRCCASLSSQCSLARVSLSLSLSLSLPFPASLRCGTSLDICGVDLVSTLSVAFFFFFLFGNFLLISMVFLFSLRFVFV